MLPDTAVVACSSSARCRSGGERDASRVHSGGVNAALVSQDGRLAVTLSKDCTARLWDLETGTCRHVLVGGYLTQELPFQLSLCCLLCAVAT